MYLPWLELLLVVSGGMPMFRDVAGDGREMALDKTVAEAGWNSEATVGDLKVLETLRRRCGPNALYMFLRLCGRSTTYAEVLKVCDPGTEGVSVLEVRDAARCLGVGLSVFRMSNDQMKHGPKPMIAYTKRAPDSNEPGGHFLVVLAVDERYVHFIDGGTARIAKWRWEDWSNLWEGYALVPEGAGNDAHLWIWSLGAWCLVGFAWFLAGGRKTIGRGRPPRCSDSLGVLLGLLCVGVGTALAKDSAAAERGELIWRTPDHDAANSLYVLLRLHDCDVTYPEVHARCHRLARSLNLGDIQRLAGELGVSLEMSRCSPTELTQSRLPAIIHAERARGQGGFALLLGRTREGYLVMAGDTACIHEVTADEFRRAWTGYVLTDKDSVWAGWRVSGALGAGVLGFYCWWHIRRTGRPRSRRESLQRMGE